MAKFTVRGTAHAAFAITVDAEDEEEAYEKANKSIVDAIEFGKPDRCDIDVDMSFGAATS